MGTWIGELRIPVLKQKSPNISAKPSLFSFSPLFSLHPSQEYLFHREMHFLCPVCDACDIFSENEILLQHFHVSGSQEEIMNEDFNPQS